MKRNKIISILEYSARNKILVGILAVSLIGAGGVFLSSNAAFSNSTMGINKIVLAETLNNNGNKACVINGNDSLVLYTSANSSNIQSYISVGEMLTINSYSNGYYNVTVQETGATGYIASSNIQKIISGVGYDLTSLTGTAYTTNVSTMVNLREEATMNSEALLKLKNNTSVELLGKQGEWYKVDVNGTIGYIYEEYIAIANSNITSNSSSSSSVITSKVTEVTSNSSNSLSSSSTTTSKATGATSNSNSSNSAAKATSVKSEKTTGKIKTLPNQTSRIAYIAQGRTASVYGEPSGMTNTMNYLLPGTKITLLGSESNGWYKIEYENNEVGYIRAQYVSFNKPKDSSVVNSTNTKGIYKTGYVTNLCTDGIVVFAEPNMDSSEVVRLYPGDDMYVLVQQNSWYEVRVGNEIGYIQSSDVQFTVPNNDNRLPQTSNKKMSTINCTGEVTTLCHLYSGPSTSSKMIWKVREGTKLEVRYREGDWYLVNYNGNILLYVNVANVRLL